jgi:hypothetical protein
VFRRFKFEEALYDKLEYIPLAVRRKFDLSGVSLTLAQWQSLGRGERLAICHFPINLEEERTAFRVFIREAVERSSQSAVSLLSDSEKLAAEPPADPPPAVVESSRAAGVELTKPLWEKLDTDERYVLLKLGSGPNVSRNFVPALKEFLQAYGA